MRQQIKHQSRTRNEELKTKFPIIGEDAERARYPKKSKERDADLTIFFQRADTTAVHLTGYNLGYDQDLVKRPDPLEYVDNCRFSAYALDEKRNVLGKVETVLRRCPELNVRELFDVVDLDKVHYVVINRVFAHYRRASKRRQKAEFTSGDFNRMSLGSLIFRKPKEKTWRELIALADREKSDRENAWKFPPKEMPELFGITQALEEGCRMHAFRSGSGLRVIRLELHGELKGYGEHPYAEVALQHLDEDYLVGGRDYHEVYGKRYPHYLTGDSTPTSNIDNWLLHGSTFDAWKESDQIVFQLKGYAELTIPKQVVERVKVGESVEWGWRGYTYRTYSSRLPNGEWSYSTEEIDRREGLQHHRAWMWHITKTGRGLDFWKAVLAAFKAPEEELLEEALTV